MDNKSIIISIITSLAASIVFWLVFNLIPDVIRYTKMRPRVERDIADIEMQLLFYLQIPFLESIHSSSVFQSDIINKKLTKIDFENALFGKCLSIDRCVNEFEHRLLPVGEKLKKSVEELDIRLDRIQRYSDFMRMKEILLLKELGEKIHTYQYEEFCNVIDGVVFQSVDPTISYMSSNFYEIYLIYHALVDICDSFILMKRSMYEKYECAKRKLFQKKYVSYIARWLFVNRKYKILLKLEKVKEKSKIDKIEKVLIEFLKVESSNLVSLRGYLGGLVHEESLRDVLTRIRGENEVQEWISCVDSEEIRRKRFELRNAENKKIVEEKIKNTPKIDELNENEITALNKLFNGYI